MLKPILTCSFLFCLIVPSAKLISQTQPAASVSAATPAAAPALLNPQTPEEFFARARQLSDLEASGIPFHLKATFVASGDAEFTGNGTYEEWWQSKDVWRKEATLGDYKYVAIQNGQKSVASATAAYTPLRVREVMGLQIFHIAMPRDNKEAWKLSQGIEGSGTQEVITEEKLCDPSHGGILCRKKYEITGQGMLRTYRDNDISEVYSNFQPFGKLFFPRTIVITLRGDPLLAVDITSLEALSAADRGLLGAKPPIGLTAMPSQFIEGISAKGVMPPKPIHISHPKYPKSERKSHSEGTIIVACTIDATGAVREPYVQLSGGAAFDQAAMDAVRKYRFRPVMKNGEPGMADLNILINFRIF